MIYYFFIFMLIFFNNFALAEEYPIALEKVNINQADIASLKRGAHFFAKNCMVCHTLIYLRYDKLSQDAGVLYNKMPLGQTKWPFDVKPPDLSLEVSRRGSDWVYTYLHSFYSDSHRPTGFNNLLVKNTVMPGIVVPMQGQQILLPNAQIPKNLYQEKHQWYDWLKLVSPGSMSVGEFDSTIKDVVNYLTYASEPYANESYHLGLGVIIFLMILLIFVYLLKHAYWKKLER